MKKRRKARRLALRFPLRSPPPPLVDRERRVIVLWSPKSACTATYVWFSSLCGFVDDVRRYARFPHTHRMEVYRFSDRYRQSIEADTSDFHIVKVLRDPYARAVSIFRQALVTGFADDDLAARGLSFTKGGVSFRQFLSTTSRQEMTIANPHYRPQVHPLETVRTPDTVINISKSDLFTELNALERSRGWPVTDFAALTWFHALETSRKTQPLASGDERLFRHPLVRADNVFESSFPNYGQLLTPSARRRIEHIYRVDFEAYRAYL